MNNKYGYRPRVPLTSRYEAYTDQKSYTGYKPHRDKPYRDTYGSDRHYTRNDNKRDYNKYLRSPIPQLSADTAVLPEKLYRYTQPRGKVTKNQNSGFVSRLKNILGKFSLESLESDTSNVDELKDSLKKRVKFKLEPKEKETFIDDDPVEKIIGSHRVDDYGKDDYGRDGYGKENYGKDDYGRDGYGKEDYGKENYGKDDLSWRDKGEWGDKGEWRDKGEWKEKDDRWKDGESWKDDDLRNRLSKNYDLLSENRFSKNKDFLSENNRKNNDLLLENNRLSKNNDELRRENNRLSSENMSMRRSEMELKEEIQALKRNEEMRNEEMRKRDSEEMRARERKFGEMIDSLKRECSEMELKQRSLKREYERIESQKSELQREKDTINHNYNSLQHDYNLLQQKLHRKADELDQLTRSVQDLKQRHSEELAALNQKVKSSSTTIADLMRQLSEISDHYRSERDRADQLQIDLEYRQQELEEKAKELESVGVVAHMRHKLTVIKEKHERERLRILREHLHLESTWDRFKEEYRSHVSTVLPEEKPDVFDQIRDTIEKEIKALRAHNLEGRPLENTNSATFFADLKGYLEESQSKKKRKVDEVSGLLLSANLNSDTSVKELYEKKYKDLCKLRKINELMSRMNVLSEYKEDASVIYGDHEVYKKVKGEINGEFL